MRAIYYRSDTRDPDGIFAAGFKKRDPSNFQQPIFRSTGPDRAEDIVPASAVCFTRDFYAAPLFPVSKPNANSWVYVLELDPAGVFNTQEMQFKDVEKRGLNTASQGREALWPMFGQERCADAIAAADIVGALHISRQIQQDIMSGGTFTCLAFRPNPAYAGQQAAAVSTSMLGFVNAGTPLQTATQQSGVVRNDHEAI